MLLGQDVADRIDKLGRQPSNVVDLGSLAHLEKRSEHQHMSVLVAMWHAVNVNYTRTLITDEKEKAICSLSTTLPMMVDKDASHSANWRACWRSCR